MKFKWKNKGSLILLTAPIICLSMIVVVAMASTYEQCDAPVFQDKCKEITDTVIVYDEGGDSALPNRFRISKQLNISGSAQFSISQLPNMIKAIGEKGFYDVDLRQESHGFVNGIAVSEYSFDAIINNGYTSAETLEAEKKLFGEIKNLKKPLDIFSRRGMLLNKIEVKESTIEEVVSSKCGLKYKLFAVRDSSIPSLKVVEDFVNFANDEAKGKHIHFHCDAGEGRTTTFMAMYQIMNNPEGLTLEQILQYQKSIGGITLTESKDRSAFLRDFYNYVDKNKANGYKVSYREWVNSINMYS